MSKTATVTIVRDFWDSEGIRHRAGTEREMALEAAIIGIDAGSLRLIQINDTEEQSVPRPRGRPRKSVDADTGDGPVDGDGE